MTEYLQAIATILSLVNPAICAAIFTKAEESQPANSQVADATKAMTAVFVILSLTALAGTSVLRAFGISLNAFQVAGGAVLIWMGFSMLRGFGANAPAAEPTLPSQPTLTPLILFAASPGTITGVITLSATHTPHVLPTTSLVAVGVASILTWGVLLLSIRLASGKSSQSLVHDVVSKFMGLIVLAMGVQFALTGIRLFMSTH